MASEPCSVNQPESECEQIVLDRKHKPPVGEAKIGHVIDEGRHELAPSVPAAGGDEPHVEQEEIVHHPVEPSQLAWGHPGQPVEIAAIPSAIPVAPVFCAGWRMKPVLARDLVEFRSDQGKEDVWHGSLYR